MSYNQIVQIPMSQIVANPNQPRRFFDDESLLELSESIKVHGLLQPIVVRMKADDQYEIIAGERRFRAYELLDETSIPAIIKDIDTKDSAILAMIENIQRDNLHFVEVAAGYGELMQQYGLTQTELASIVGKDQSTIANKCRILNLPQEVLELVITEGLTERHARALLKLKNDERLMKVVRHIIKKEMNVKQTEIYINNLLEADEKSDDVQTKELALKRYLKDIRLFTNTIKQAVDMVNESGVEAKYVVREANDKYTITIEIPIEK